MEKIKQLDWIEIIGYAAIVFLIFIMGLIYFIDRAEGAEYILEDNRTGRTEESSLTTCGSLSCPRTLYRNIANDNYAISKVSSTYFWGDTDCISYLSLHDTITDNLIATSSDYLNDTGGTNTRNYIFNTSTAILYENQSFDIKFNSSCSNEGYTYGIPQTQPYTNTPIWGTIYADNDVSPEIIISLAYPSSSITTPLKGINNWVIQISGIYDKNGQIGINYGQNSSNLNYSYADCNVRNGFTECEVQGETNLYSIINRTNLGNASNGTTTWYAQPYFFNSDSLSFTKGSIVEFQIDTINGQNPSSNEIDPNITAIGNGNNNVPNTPGYYQPTSTEDIWCISPSATSSFLDGWWLSYSLCRVSEILLKPHDISSNYVISNFNTMRELFPLSIVNNIITPLTALGESTSTGNTSYTLTIPDIGNVNIISSSSFTNSVGITTQTNILNFQKMIIWVLAGISALLIIF